MRTIITIMALSLCLAACASTQSTTGQQARAAVPGERYNEEFIARYESAARRGGVRVYWVNRPRRRE